MALVLTESIIRDRVNLLYDNLDAVKSLALPGTYQEKIAALGNSLQHFSRLKELDLSRNALTSLAGLDHLCLLEKLNLYYNNIHSLDEFRHLYPIPGLKDLDVRLNPITRDEPDYRLYLIHHLPSLRILDDRTVSERERNVAYAQYSTNTEFPRIQHHRGNSKNDQAEEDLNGRRRYDHTYGDEDADIVAEQTHSQRNGEVFDHPNPLIREAVSTPTDLDQYTNAKSVGYFTPHPGKDNSPAKSNSPKPVIEDSVDAHKECLEKLLHIVDKYWNGSKSLHNNSKFRGQAMKLLSSLSLTTNNNNNDYSHTSRHADGQARAAKAENALQQAYADLTVLKQNIDISKQENQQLQEKLSRFETEAINHASYLTQIEQLRLENTSLKQRLEKAEKLEDLIEMLQESHKSLVNTNNYLLQQISSDRRQHQHDVEQLNSSYNRLRRHQHSTATT